MTVDQPAARWDPSENCYCGGPEEIYPHRRGTGQYCRRSAAPTASQKAHLGRNGATYLPVHPDLPSAQQLAVRDDLLVDVAADGRICGVERIGDLVAPDDLVAALAAVRHRCVPAYQPGESPSTPARTPCPEGFHWIGQSFVQCEKCGLPAWEHAGIAEPNPDDPFTPSGTWTLRPWKPGQREACRALWVGPSPASASTETQ